MSVQPNERIPDQTTHRSRLADGTDILECLIHLVEYDELWGHFEKLEKTGAAYMTELCDDSNERRGVGINRWACAMRDFCK